MSAPTNRIESARKHFALFRETWKRDHDEAMRCRDCEDALDQLTSVFRWMMRASGEWRDFVYRGSMPPDVVVEEQVKNFLAEWLEAASELEAEIAQNEANQFRVEGALDFRIDIQSAREILRKWVPAMPSRAVGCRTWEVSEDEAEQLRTLIANQWQLGWKPKSIPLGDESLFR